MANRKCPSCGTWHSRKTCPNCLYTSFDEERAWVPFGEAPKTRETPSPEQRVEKRKSRQARKAWDHRRSRRSTNTNIGRKIVLVFVITLGIIIFSSMAGVMIAAVNSIGHNYIMAEPEAEIVELPEDGTILYNGDGLLVVADWNDSYPIDDDIPIYVQNTGEREVVVCTNGVAVNGCMVDDVFFYCEAIPGATSMGTLWIDTGVLGEMGIGEAANIQMLVEAYDADTYDSVGEPFFAELTADGREDFVETLNTDGTVIYDQDGVTLIYQGHETDEYGDTRLFFYAENNTGRYLELSSSELMVDGEETNCYLWQDFFPETKAVIDIWVYDFEVTEDMGILEFSLYSVLDGNWETETESGVLTMNVN